MSLSTDALLFSIVLLLAAVYTALPFDAGSANFLIAGLGVAVVAFLGSVVTTVAAVDVGPAEDTSAER